MQLSDLLKSINPSNAQDMQQQVVSSIMDGEENPLQMFVGLTILKKTLDELRDRLMAPAINELEKYGSRDVPMYEALLSIKESGISWDFRICEFPAWQELSEKEAAIVLQRKAIEDILKKFYEKPFMEEYVNEETAEIVKRTQLNSAPIKKSTTIVEVKIPKKINKNQ